MSGETVVKKGKRMKYLQSSWIGREFNQIVLEHIKTTYIAIRIEISQMLFYQYIIVFCLDFSSS